MPNTTNRQYPYPEASKPADVPYWLQQLAEKVDADTTKLFEDIGWISIVPSTAGMSAGSDGVSYRRRGGYVFIQMHLVLNSATLRGTVFTLPVGFRPTRVLWTTMQSSGSPQAELKVSPTGVVQVAGTPGNATGMVGYISFPVD